jgi:hypothetical protein
MRRLGVIQTHSANKVCRIIKSIDDHELTEDRTLQDSDESSMFKVFMRVLF